MPTIARLARLRPGAESAYEELHRRVPDELLEALVAAGVEDWRIWRSGRSLLNVIDLADREAMRAAMRASAAQEIWRPRVVPLLEPDDGADPPLLWSLRAQCDGGA